MRGSKTIEAMLNDYEFSPEANLWVHVLIKFIEDMDRVVHFIYGEMLPRKVALEKELITNFSTADAVRINNELIRLDEGLTRCFSEINSMLYQLDNEWCHTICDFIDVNYIRFKEIAHEIIKGKIVIKERKSFLDFQFDIEGLLDYPLPNLTKNLPSSTDNG